MSKTKGDFQVKGKALVKYIKMRDKSFKYTELQSYFYNENIWSSSQMFQMRVNLEITETLR